MWTSRHDASRHDRRNIIEVALRSVVFQDSNPCGRHSRHLKAEITAAENVLMLTLIHGDKITECGLMYSKNALILYFIQGFQILDCNFTLSSQLLNLLRIVM